MSKSKETNDGNAPTWPVDTGLAVGIVRLKKGAEVFTWVDDKSVFDNPTPLYVIGGDAGKFTLKLATQDFINVCEIPMSDVDAGFTCQIFGDLILPDSLNLKNQMEIIKYIEENWGSEEEYYVKRALIIERSLLTGFLVDKLKLDGRAKA